MHYHRTLYCGFTHQAFLHQSSDPANTVFAVVRNKGNAKGLAALGGTAKNVHILEADVTDVAALKVR